MPPIVRKLNINLCRRWLLLPKSIVSRWPHPEQRAWHSIKSFRPFRLAIIGSGPAGFYTASKVMRRHNTARIDMYEHLPIPFGLVRYGVAPDHPEVKNCQDRFDECAELPNFHFFGNVNVGFDISLAEMKPHYDAICFAYGASKDRRLGIPGEDLEGVYSARDFVAWYNGLPDYADLKPRLDEGSDVVVIGQGNVALDVARVLLSNVDVLRKTDMPEYALELLSRSKVSSVRAVGRRGPMQGAFTIKEIRELINLPNVSFDRINRDLFPEDLKTLPRARRRIAELLVKSRTTPLSAAKSFSLDFLLSPTSFNSHSSTQNQLSQITFQQTHYTDPTTKFEASATVSTDDQSPKPIILPASMAFRSIGYKSEPLPGLSDLHIPFNTATGTIPNALGRVTLESTPGVLENSPLPGIYAAGWVKRGPTGVIASTMEDAFATAESIVKDLESGQSMLNYENGGSTGLGWEGIEQIVHGKGVRRTSWEDWRRIDEVEKERGWKLGKEREKITDVGEMLRIVDT
ncbi:NADPH:adrenodoxin oxidoreductase [Tothia fuscella]|uniref:NADPH:adrenodoxin oxidoreductase, mitochondrial n=1 Tax=Tothia fuscella TaxID=1048955 RepID=A0A9P4TYN4_9PEZI|nr:NADPH:adrenodoxin oxidoreductase [Tothia fuscella]